jgi:hypothetical protein
VDLKETGWGGVDWIDLTQNMGQWPESCEHGNELSDSENAKNLTSAELLEGMLRE